MTTRSGWRAEIRSRAGTISRSRLTAASCLAAVLTLALTGSDARATEANSTAGSSVESYYGSFGTSVSIDVPRFRGLEPKLELSYNSQGRDSHLGVGWQLAGFPIIERSSAGKGAPGYNASDIFLLDGMELVPCTTLGGTHCSKIQSYQRITWDAAANAWYVWQKDGIKLTFTPQYSTGRGVFRWALTAASDPRGNTVSYGYWCDNGADCYPDQVSYNGTLVKFYREGRPDQVTFATGDNVGRTNYRIKTIDVTTSGARVRSYKLSYSTSAATSRSLLSSVQQFGNDAVLDGTGTVVGGTAMPAQSMSYQGATASLPYSGGSSAGVETYWSSVVDNPTYKGKAFPMDINGDGKSDLAMVYQDVNNRTTLAQHWISDGTKLVYSSSSTAPGETYWSSVVDSPTYHGKAFPMDINGDGKTDLAMIYQDVNNRTTLAQHWLSDGTKLVYSSSSTAPVETYWSSVIDSPTYQGKAFAMDINGDGKGDLVMIYQDVNNRTTLAQHWISDGTKLVYSSSSSTNTETYWTSVVESSKYHGKVFPMDVNGDGKGDLVMIYQDVDNRTTLAQHWISDGTKLVYSGGSTAGAETYWSSVVDSPTYHGKALPMDVNGDGKGDLVMVYQDVNNRVTLAQHWISNGNKLVYSGGASTTGETYWTSVVDSPTYHGQVLPMDVNGDGKGDLVLIYQDVNNRVTLEQHWLSDGNKLVYSGSGSTTGETYWTSVVDSPTYRGKVFPMDMSGDGKTDLVMIYQDVNNRTTLEQHWIAGGASSDLLSSVTNSLGGTTTVSYRPSSSFANTLMPEGLILQTASAVTTSDGRGASSTTSYNYAGGLWSSAERRFLGFRKVTAVLDAAGNYTETYYHQHVGCVAKPETTYYRNAAGAIYRYSTYGYTENATAPYTSLMTDRWEYECNLTGSCKRTLLQIGYDEFGNGTTTYEHGDFDVAGDERTSIRQPVPNTGNYIVSLPAYENIFAGIGTSGALLKQTLFEYDGSGTYAAPPSRGLLSRKKAWNSQTGSYVARSFGYDAWGNLTAETDERGATTTIEFDAARRTRETRRCNALGQCSAKTWEPNRDLVSSETDLNGNVTSYTHDALGRPVTTSLPNGTTETLSYIAWGNPNWQRVRRTISDGTADGLWTEIYEDGLGRQYKQLKDGGLVQETLYSDASKRVWKKSGWYGPGEVPQYQVFAFDGLGRIRTVTNPDGTVGQTYYGNDHVVTYDELGHEKVTWLDAYGQTRSIREKNGAAYQFTTFQHDMLGNLTRVTDAAGNVTTVTWDSLGRKLMGYDPDTGCSSYTYDDAGQVVTRTDAKGQLTRVDYDAVGRPVTKTLADGSQTKWAYDEAGHGASKGAWTTITDPSGSESRSYDSSGRITSTTKCVGAVCATTGYAYDAAGRTASITYPDGEVVSYAYDAAGRLSYVPGYANSIEYNARGQVTSILFANETRANYSYDQRREWLTAANVTGPAGTLFQMGYSYDAAARVIATSSSTNPLSALSFGYDDLGRVTTVSGGQSQSFAYDALGNIIQNSAVGAYGYGDGAHRHAVTAAGATGFSYDTNGNMVAGAGRVLTWNAENRLASVTRNGVTIANDYDFAGERVKRTAQGIPRYFFSRLAEYEQGVYTKHIYAGNMLIASNRGGAKTFVHSDHLGSTRLITDVWGQKIQDYDYAPFGQTARAAGSAVNAKLYGGHEQDVDSGLIYMHARYYDASIGRFISPDSLIPDPRNPQAFNRYAYVYNNPISNADPTGHVPVVAAVITCASVGATVGVTSTAFAISVVGAATMSVGYFAKDPTLMSIGGVLLGAGSGLAFGAGFLGAQGTVQAAVVSGGVSLMTSPISPLDPKLKQAIGWAYTAQSLIYDFQHIDETIDKNAREYGDKNKLSEKQIGELQSKAEKVTPANLDLATAAQRRYGEAMEQMTNGALKAGQAIALNPTGGIIGPDAGFQAQLLELLTGWMPGMRVHAVLHDAGGQLGNYPWAGNWFNLNKTSMLTGHIEGISRAGGASNAALYSRMYGW